ncbi:Serine/threonine-protein phosphatase 6 regulatory subunit 2 [Tritrichomonas musculus]|uniref:Serine/threonine-protein phosphatase 6 regulatory subunit 2 n=1 Tax=Tritrichomonas musculus TaxID=1915356 RepID=A0ABR2JU26_9EUKA
MLWNFGGPSLSGITKALQSEDCKLEDILLDSTLSQAIRNSLRELIDFITKENVLNDLLDWVLTNKNKDNANCQKLTRNALSIFTANSQQIIKAISGHELFVQRIQSFIDSNSDEESIHDARIGGHFQRIIEHYVRQTSGRLLSELKNLPTFLIHNMSILGLRELFVLMTVDFVDKFDLKSEDIEELSKEITKENGYFVITAIKSILLQKPLSVIKYFQNPTIFKNLLEAAIESKKAERQLIATEIYKTLVIITEKATNESELKPLLNEYGEKFLLDNTDVDCSTAFAILLFQVFNQQFFDHLFTKPINTFLNQSIIIALKKMEIEKRDSILKEYDALSLLQKSYNETTINGQLYELYNIIKNTYKLPTPQAPTENIVENPDLSNQETTTTTTDKPEENTEPPTEQPDISIQLPDGWNELSATIEAELKIQESGYGGDLPKNSFSFSSDSDIEMNVQSDSDDELIDEDDSYEEEIVEEEEEEEAKDKEEEINTNGNEEATPQPSNEL